MKQKRHGHNIKKTMGRYHQNELAILGTTCNQIKELSIGFSNEFKDLKIGYMDASHNTLSDVNHSFALSYVDEQDSYRTQTFDSFNDFDLKFLYKDQDVLLINGNHFRGGAQIVCLDRSKEKSLFKRLDQLNNIVLFIQMEEDSYFPDFLNDMVSDNTDIAIIKISDTKGINNFFHNWYNEKVCPLYGLVLAGGHSTRMGIDKGKIQYQDDELRKVIFNKLSPFVEKCFFSIRPDQRDELSEFPLIEDKLANMGPFGALVSAFMEYPDASWLIVACDQTLIEGEAFEMLINQRDVSKIATAFKSESTGFPDPLPAIWESKSYGRLLDFLSIGYSCPRKVLINSDINLIETKAQEWLFNMNTPEDARKINLEL